ncbi:LysR family transcriptional regulator [Paracoccus rhizosphaerae]|uniref:LysR family transcriptional regulator n=1 Tax=Paracoccus rhizosphaerae TaxID=1133347 RepID=A0ABV6CMR3_9RHOB|nr:LysR family transcriptional regulator [Paracoccus rhizosphaerae]
MSRLSNLQELLGDDQPVPRGRLSNWGMLRTFHFIASEGSITGAARRLAISQPSVSAALQRLEDVLDHQLVDRGARRITLTRHGQILYAETQRIFRAVQRAEERLRFDGGSLTGQIRIQIVTGSASALFNEGLRLMHQRQPSVNFRIDVASSHKIVRNVAEQIVPFGICLMVQPAPGLDCRLILRSEYGIFCGREHRLFGATDVALSDLREEGYIGFTCAEEGAAPEPLVTLRNSHGLGHNIRGNSADFAEVCRMVEAGLGISILPLATIRQSGRDTQLWQFPIEGCRLSADMYFVTNPQAQHAPAEEAFLQVMDDVIVGAPDAIHMH